MKLIVNIIILFRNVLSVNAISAGEDDCVDRSPQPVRGHRICEESRSGGIRKFVSSIRLRACEFPPGRDAYATAVAYASVRVYFPQDRKLVYFSQAGTPTLLE